jgi:hypothetical protein
MPRQCGPPYVRRWISTIGENSSSASSNLYLLKAPCLHHSQGRPGSRAKRKLRLAIPVRSSSLNQLRILLSLIGQSLGHRLFSTNKEDGLGRKKSQRGKRRYAHMCLRESQCFADHMLHGCLSDEVCRSEIPSPSLMIQTFPLSTTCMSSFSNVHVLLTFRIAAGRSVLCNSCPLPNTAFGQCIYVIQREFQILKRSCSSDGSDVDQIATNKEPFASRRGQYRQGGHGTGPHMQSRARRPRAAVEIEYRVLGGILSIRRVALAARLSGKGCFRPDLCLSALKIIIRYNRRRLTWPPARQDHRRYGEPVGAIRQT